MKNSDRKRRTKLRYLRLIVGYEELGTFVTYADIAREIGVTGFTRERVRIYRCEANPVHRLVELKLRRLTHGISQ